MNNTDTLLIFDCDGVLVDSEPIAGRAIIKCLRDEGFDVNEAYVDKYFLGISNRDCIAHVESAFKRKVSHNFLETLSQITHDEIEKSLQPIPHIKEALELLPYPRCVASGSEPEKILLSLELTGLKKYFTHLFSASQVKRGKPFPDIFLHAAKEMNFSAEQCIVIEDSDPGWQAALSAGMKVFLYRPLLTGNVSFPKGVTIFNDMNFLPTLIRQAIDLSK